MHINFISFKGTGQPRTICVWSNNENIMSGNETKNKKDDNFFQYALTLALNYNEI